MIDYMEGMDFSALKIWLTEMDVSAGEWMSRINAMSNLRLLSIIFLVVGAILLVFLGTVVYLRALIRRSAANAFMQAGKASPGNVSPTGLFENRAEEMEMEPGAEDILEAEPKTVLEVSEKEKPKETLKKEEKPPVLEPEAGEKERDDEKHPKNSQVLLDWYKNTGRQKSGEVSEKDLSYRKTSKKLSDLIGLLIDMLSRGIDDYKIAQTLMYKTQGTAREDDILQLIESIRNFIALGINGRFEVLRKNKSLPAVEEALLHLAEGDTSQALILMEALMDYNISKASGLKQEGRREAAMMDTSFLGLVFGSLAGLNDSRLALEAFELSIELNPKNIGSWSKAADMYADLGMRKKAVWAYESILEKADERAHPRQMAHARKMLAANYQREGDSIRAKKLYDNSRDFYDSIGINKKPERHEIDVIDLIESRSRSEFKQAVLGLLNIRSLGQYSHI